MPIRIIPFFGPVEIKTIEPAFFPAVGIMNRRKQRQQRKRNRR
jgi:hypothetical protein